MIGFNKDYNTHTIDYLYEGNNKFWITLNESGNINEIILTVIRRVPVID